MRSTMAAEGLSAMHGELELLEAETFEIQDYDESSEALGGCSTSACCTSTSSSSSTTSCTSCSATSCSSCA